jgi:hypothetical protein
MSLCRSDPAVVHAQAQTLSWPTMSAHVGQPSLPLLLEDTSGVEHKDVDVWEAVGLIAWQGTLAQAGNPKSDEP